MVRGLGDDRCQELPCHIARQPAIRSKKRREAPKMEHKEGSALFLFQRGNRTGFVPLSQMAADRLPRQCNLEMLHSAAHMGVFIVASVTFMQSDI